MAYRLMPNSTTTTYFKAPHHFANTVGAISLCLQLTVTPVFVPPFEHGMQNTIESFNALWQAKLWQRCRVGGVSELQMRSDRYIAAHRALDEIESAALLGDAAASTAPPPAQ